MQLYNQPIFTAATTGWFDTAATTVNLQPTYYYPPVAPDPTPPASMRQEPLDWLRSRVGECVAAGTL